MTRNRKIAAGLLAGLLAGATAGAWAQTPGPEQEQERQQAQQELDRQEADRQRQLEEAQRQLEEAAREVARLSAEISGPLVRELRRIHVGSPNRAMLGVNIGRAEPGTRGVRVRSVSPGGPAAEAGVVSGDLIIALNDRELGTGRDLVDGMRELKPGERVKLGLLRGKDRKDVYVVVRAMDEWPLLGAHGLPAPGAPGMPGRPHLPHFLLGPWGDAEFVEVTPGLGRYFGTDTGLLVVRVPDAAGGELAEGDVILSIGGRTPQDAGHALRILASYQPGETVQLEIMRDRKRSKVELRIPEDGGGLRGLVLPRAPAAPPPPG